MEKISEQIGTRIRELRKEQKLTLEQLAEKAGISYTYLGDIERKRRSCTISTLENIVKALGCDLADFFKDEEILKHRNIGNYLRLIKQIPVEYDEVVTETLRAFTKMPKHESHEECPDEKKEIDSRK